ncbi:MAG: M20 metallopeptidase family protein [Candidatus Marinamargulisbacteria bacterium]
MPISYHSLFSTDLTRDLIQLRETLHQYPELSNQEIESQKALLTALKKCHVIDIQTPGTSIVARLKGLDSSRPPVAIRGDIDALPITETTGVPFESNHPGVMHACGHDVHATWAVGAARLLSVSPAKSDVMIILQQAEEVATGAKFLLDSGVLPSNIRAIFGAHVDRRYDVGQVVCHTGAISSYSDRFFIDIKGVSAHAARPNEGINPVPLLGHVIIQLNKLMGDIGNDTNIITPTQVMAGKANNIIPDQAQVSGTIRCLSRKKRALFQTALHELRSLATDCDIHVRIESSSPAVMNDPALEPMARRAIRTAVGDAGIVPLIAPNMASEDFGYYTQAFPGWFYRVGARPVGDAFIPVHTSSFIADTESIFVGASILANAARFAAELGYG